MVGSFANSRGVPIKAILLALAFAFCGRSFAQNVPRHASDTGAHVFVIVHIDVLPPGTVQTVNALQAVAQHARSESGCIKFQVLQQIGRPNHFTLVEEWASQGAYDADIGSPETRDFREKLQPLLGSPFDERLHTQIK